MQCFTNTHCTILFYPQTHRTRCFPQQEQRISHDVDEKSKLITSASNPFVKHCLKLRNNSSYRRSHASVLVVGTTPIRF